MNIGRKLVFLATVFMVAIATLFLLRHVSGGVIDTTFVTDTLYVLGVVVLFGSVSAAPALFVWWKQKRTIIHIDRSLPFDPVAFMGEEGWSLSIAPNGETEQDHNSLAITSLDSNKVCLVSEIFGPEPYVSGEQRLRCLVSLDYVRLDAQIFQAFERRPDLLEKMCARTENGAPISLISFDGTILRHPLGYRCVLFFIKLSTDAKWKRGVGRLRGDWYTKDPAAVLEA